MASAPSASWNSRCITHLANCPNRSLPTNSSDESFFERVIASAPDSPLGHIGLAEALWGARYETGKISFKGKAFTELGKAEQLDPEMAQVYLIRGRLEDRKSTRLNSSHL